MARSVVGLQLAILGYGCIAGCRPANVPSGPAAVVFAATAVGASALIHSKTGECYAICSKGWHCDRETGFCRRDREQEKLEQPLPTVKAEDDGAQQELQDTAAPAAVPQPEGETVNQASSAESHGTTLKGDPEASIPPSVAASPNAPSEVTPINEPGSTGESATPSCPPPFRCARKPPR